jgi:sulfonate transport system substrate-binding protein
MSIRNRARRALCFAVLTLLACGRGGGQPTPEAPALEPLRFGFIGTGEVQPVGAEGFGFKQGSLVSELERLGFQKPHFVRFANGPDLNEALSGGSIDLGIYGDTPALVGRAAGLPTRLVNQSVVGMDAWLLAPAGGVKSLEQLAGKIVATSKGSYMHRYLAGLLLEKGLSGKVTLAHLLPGDAQAALERGDIAAYAAPAQTAPLLVRGGAVIIDRASDHPGLSGSSVTVVTEAFLQKHPGFPRQWNSLRERAVAELLGAPDGYYAFHSEAVRLPLDVVKQGYPLTLFHREPLGAAGRSLLEGTKRFLVSQGLAQRDFELDAWCAADVASP